jgi:hypothetical protein
MVTLTRGVCRAIPRFFAIALAEVTTPLAMRPGPPSFSLAKTKIVSPLAICLPPYIVFCVLNANVFAPGSLTSALIANIISGCGRNKTHPEPLLGRAWNSPSELIHLTVTFLLSRL